MNSTNYLDIEEAGVTVSQETIQKIDDQSLQDALQRAYNRAIVRRASSIVLAHYDIVEEWHQKGVTFEEISLALAELGITIKPMTLRVLFSKERSKRKMENENKKKAAEKAAEEQRFQQILPLMKKIYKTYPTVEDEFDELKNYRTAFIGDYEYDVTKNYGDEYLTDEDRHFLFICRLAYFYKRDRLFIDKLKFFKFAYQLPALSDEEINKLAARLG